MWLAQDLGVAVAGSLNEKATVIAFSGPNLSRRKTLVRDFSNATPGRILAVAASPDGMELAAAVAEPGRHVDRIFESHAMPRRIGSGLRHVITDLLCEHTRSELLSKS